MNSMLQEGVSGVSVVSWLMYLSVGVNILKVVLTLVALVLIILACIKYLRKS